MIFLLVVTIDTLILDLNTAINLALKNNRSLTAERYKLIGEYENINIARSNFLPKLSVTGTGVRTGKVSSMRMPKYGLAPVFGKFNGLPNPFDTIGYTYGIVGDTTIEFSKDEIYTLRGQITQPIFTFGKLFGAYKLAKCGYKLRQISYAKEVNDLKYKVKKAFYETILAEKVYELVFESYKSLKQHVAQVKRCLLYTSPSPRD